MKMDIGMAGRVPLIDKNMNIVTGQFLLMNIALHKLLGTPIKNKFLPDDGYFHGIEKPKGLRVRIAQGFLINSNSLVHHSINAQFIFAEGISFLGHGPT